MKEREVLDIGHADYCECVETNSQHKCKIKPSGWVSLSNKPHILWFPGVINPRGMLREHEPEASVLQAFRVFSQHPKWVYYAGKPIENAVYCFYEIIVSRSMEFHEKVWFLMQ